MADIHECAQCTDEYGTTLQQHACVQNSGGAALQGRGNRKRAFLENLISGLGSRDVRARSFVYSRHAAVSSSLPLVRRLPRGGDGSRLPAGFHRPG